MAAGQSLAAMRTEHHRARPDLRSSIRAQARNAHPLMRVPGRWSKDFLDSLSARDRKEYELAVEYWRETWQGQSLPRHHRSLAQPPAAWSSSG